MIGKQGVSLLIGHNGVQDKTALDATNETVNKGVYDPTTLSAVDADLAVGNIRETVTIFGFLGTLPAGGVETLERYYSQNLAAEATYTPLDSGIFFVIGGNKLSPKYAGWRPVDTGGYRGFTAIGDGGNLGILCSPSVTELLMMRHYITTWTYETDYDAGLAQDTAYVPSDGGFFACGTEWTSSPLQINKTTAGWVKAEEWFAREMPLTITIGDGVNLRIYQTSPGSLHTVLLRCSQD